ncbi:hypothetical protein PT974_05440 [Cladobotryum mycophilum]|uniref:Uncharacterized protein n=1 Tax=Cladobotryum mycophilum TaxID=491253 RepID=A0ABR0SJ46_9HYPO
MAQKVPWEGRTPSSAIGAITRHFLTVDEGDEIYRQFRKRWVPNRQVLYDGLPHETVQKWADKHGMQTFATSMGRLIDPKHPKCHREKKSPKEWSDYIHGASVIYCWLISGGDEVTVLLQPPLEDNTRPSSSGQTFYQTVQEPIVTGRIGDRSVKWLHVVQPTVKGSANYTCVIRSDSAMASHKPTFGGMMTHMKNKMKKPNVKSRTKHHRSRSNVRATTTLDEKGQPRKSRHATKHKKSSRDLSTKQSSSSKDEKRKKKSNSHRKSDKDKTRGKGKDDDGDDGDDSEDDSEDDSDDQDTIIRGWLQGVQRQQLTVSEILLTY